MQRLKILAMAVVLAAAAGAAPSLAVELKPYGFVLVNMIEHWNRPNFLDVPTQALSTDDADTRDTYGDIHVRQTRLGLTASGVSGPAGSTATAVVELDFWGNRASGAGGNDVLQSGVRLRLAFAQLQWERQTLILGQDWIKAFSPLNPASLMHQAIVPLSNSGNLWNRTPQVRWEGRLVPESAGAALDARLALVRAFSGDQTGRTTTAGGAAVASVSQPDQPGSGEASGIPAFQGLVEASRALNGGRLLFGLSGQHLRQRFRPGVVSGPAGATRGTTEGLLGSVHAALPLHRALELSGEAFYGRSDMGLQGLGQVYADGTRPKTSLSRGGWVQAALKPAPGWKFHVAHGAAKIEGTGLAAGRTYRNETTTLNVIWDATPSMSFSAEYGMIRTFFVGKAAGRTHNLGLAALYKLGN